MSDQEGYFLSPLDFLSDFFLTFIFRAALMRLVLFRFFIASPWLDIMLAACGSVQTMHCRSRPSITPAGMLQVMLDG
jgi:hypothetical protein